MSDEPKPQAPRQPAGNAKPRLANEAAKPAAKDAAKKVPEVGGPEGPEPTRYGDWERKGRVSDF